MTKYKIKSVLSFQDKESVKKKIKTNATSPEKALSMLNFTETSMSFASSPFNRTGAYFLSCLNGGKASLTTVHFWFCSWGVGSPV